MTRRELISGAAALAAHAMLARTAYGATDPVPADRLPYAGSWESLVGVQGGIPGRTAQSGSTIAPYTGSAGAINTALANCPADSFVQLGAGTFNLSSSIWFGKSHVTLRGAVNANGAPGTIVNFTTNASVSIGDTGWDVANSGAFTNINVSAGASRGSTTVTVASTPSTLAVGQIMFISAPSNAQITGESSWSAWFGTRAFTQIVKVTGKSGNNVTFTPAINADYLTGAVQIHYRSAGTTTVLSGVENLNLMVLNGTSSNSEHYLRLYGTDSCWARNIKTYWSAGGGAHHCYLYATFRSEIRHCEMSHVTPNGAVSSNAYAILGVHSSNYLIEDNYFHDLPNVMPSMGMNTGAFAYNYINDLPYPAQTNWLSQIVFFHGSHSHYNLFEGNWCAAHYHDGGSGVGSRNNIFFRERMRGWDAAGPKTSNTQCLTTESHHDNLVIAGCVLGEDGYHAAYIGKILALDSSSNATALRIANYNTVNDAIPAAEALASGTGLVTSYLHSSKPSWFGSLPWPWCDPNNYSQSNNFQNLPAGYRAATGTDPVETGGPPVAPSNLRIVPC